MPRRPFCPSPGAAAGGGFLLAVLWMDLLFDLQALGHAGALPEPVLASIAAYYRRVTTDAAPLHLLIATVMIVTVLASMREVAGGAGHRPRALAALALVGGSVTLAAARVLPNAVRLGTRADPVTTQSDLARAICRDHLLCLVAIAAFVVLQILSGARPADAPAAAGEPQIPA